MILAAPNQVLKSMLTRASATEHSCRPEFWNAKIHGLQI